MQYGLTSTRDSRLTAAASAIEQMGTSLGLLLRESRLDVWEEPDDTEAEWLGLIMEQTLAWQWAGNVRCARLTVPAEPGAWEIIVDSHDEVLPALRQAVPQLDSIELAEAPAGELPASNPNDPVSPCVWNGMWFRSRAEMRIAQALEAEDVLFAPNATVRLGVTQDHRQNYEPDFLVVCEGKLGVLEVDGPWHAGHAADDHERDRRFREHRIRVVERYPAERCYSMPGDVVAGFLRLLRQNG